MIKNIGEGAYGTVHKSVNRETKETVAIKKSITQKNANDDAVV